MSEATQQAPVSGPTLVGAAPAAPKVVAPAKPKSAIEVLENELKNFFSQRAQLIANSHAVEGAIQATELLLGKLKAEAAKAVAATEAEAKKIGGDIESAVDTVESEAKALLALAEKKL